MGGFGRGAFVARLTRQIRPPCRRSLRPAASRARHSLARSLALSLSRRSRASTRLIRASGISGTAATSCSSSARSGSTDPVWTTLGSVRRDDYAARQRMMNRGELGWSRDVRHGIDECGGRGGGGGHSGLHRVCGRLQFRRVAKRRERKLCMTFGKAPGVTSRHHLAAASPRRPRFVRWPRVDACRSPFRARRKLCTAKKIGACALSMCARRLYPPSRAPNTRQGKSAARQLLSKSASRSTRGCAPESTSVCGDVGEVDHQSISVAATRGRPAAAGCWPDGGVDRSRLSTGRGRLGRRG